MTKTLAGNKIVLTGVSRGVGLCTARALLEQGAEVFGVARNADRLAGAHRALEKSGRFHALSADLAEPDAAQRIAERAQQLFGQLDVLINNAGVMLWHDAEITSEPEGMLERSLAVNLLAPFRLSRALLPLLERSPEPRIIHVSSGAGTHQGMTEPGIASYRLSKWSLNGLTILQARELAGRVSVNAFDPGWVRTDLGGEKAPGTPEESAQGMLKTLALPWTMSGKFLKDGLEISW